MGWTVFGYLQEFIKCSMPDECRENLDALEVTILTDGTHTSGGVIRGIIVKFTVPTPIDSLELEKILEKIKLMLNLPPIKHGLYIVDEDKFLVVASYGSLTS